MLWDSCITVWSLYLLSALTTTVRSTIQQPTHYKCTKYTKVQAVKLCTIMDCPDSKIWSRANSSRNLVLSCCLATNGIFAPVKGTARTFVGSVESKVNSWIVSWRALTEGRWWSVLTIVTLASESRFLKIHSEAWSHLKILGLYRVKTACTFAYFF